MKRPMLTTAKWLHVTRCAGTALIALVACVPARPLLDATKAHRDLPHLPADTSVAMLDSTMQLRPYGNVRLYRVVLHPDSTYHLTARSTTLDPAVSVIRQSGPFGLSEVLASDDDGGEGTSAALTFEPLVAGEYIIVVRAVGRSNATGSVTVEMRPAARASAASAATDDARPLTATPRALPLGIAHSDSLGREVLAYSFTAQAGEHVWISAASSEFDAFLRAGTLSNGTFTGIAHDDDGGNALNALLKFRAPVTGEFVALVSAADDEGRGSFVIIAGDSAVVASASGRNIATVRTDNAASEVRIARVGIVESGRITSGSGRPGGQRVADEWKISLNANRWVSVSMKSSAFDTHVEVGRATDSSFVRLAMNDDYRGSQSESRVSFQAPVDGDYVVRAGAYGSGTGPYTLEVLQAEPLRKQPEERVLRIGTTAAGELTNDDAALDDGSPVDLWHFTAIAGRRYTVTLIGATFDAFLTVGRIEDDEFIQYWINDDAPDAGTNARVVMVPPVSGRYTIRANGIESASRGRYTIRVEQAPAVRMTRRQR